MSRTSRRISRPLLAALAVVIVLGVFFTIHKLHNTKAADARSIAATAPVTSPSAPAVVVVQPPAPPAPSPTSAPQTQPSPARQEMSLSATTQPAADPSSQTTALITQTPTARSVPRIDSPAEQNETSPAAVADAQSSDAVRPLGDRFVSLNDAASAPPAAHDAPPAVQTELSSPQSLPDLRARAQSGDVLAARQQLNDALASGRASDAEADAIKKQIDDINKTVVFSVKKFKDDPWGGTYQVASGERLSTIAARNGCSWELLSRINGVTPRRLRSGQTIKVFKGPFHAVVYKHLFKMEIYLGAPSGAGSMYITSFPVGLGKDNSTPTGMWLCRAGDKIRHPRYYPPRGGEIIAPDDPKNPLGGYWIAIEGLDGQAVGKESYGIHGTIDPSSIGKMESMGCIRLRHDDISWVFDLLVDGKSKVLIKD